MDTLTQGKMVTNKAWIPPQGTYSVSMIDTPFDSEVDELANTPAAPADQRSGDDDGTVASAEQFLHENQALEDFLNIASFANLTHVHKEEDGWKARGDPTEITIQVFASRFNWNRLRFLGGHGGL